MAIRVFLSPVLKRYRPDYNPDQGLIVEARPGKTVRQIAEELGIPLDEVSSTLIDYQVVEPNYAPKDNDTIHFLVAISGG